MLRTASTVTFACYSKVCAPPPAGKGGSVKGGASTASAAGIKRMYSGFEHNGVRVRSVEVGPSRAGERKTVLTFVDARNREVGRAIHYFNENRPDEVHHDTLLFKSSERGKGLGAAFLRHCVEQYRSAGVKKVTLWAASTPGSSGLVGAAVWGKLGFDFHGRKQKDLADAMGQYNEARGFGEPEAFSKSLRRAVSRGTASIKDVMKADPGDFLNGQWGQDVNWDGTLLLDEVTLTAAAKPAVTLSYAEWADAEERYLRPRSSSSAGSLVAACYSKACAPPPTGRGGSSKGAGVTRSGSRAWRDWMWGGSHTHSSRIAAYAGHVMGVNSSSGKVDRRYQVRGNGLLDAIRDGKPSKFMRQHATGGQVVPEGSKVGSVVTLRPIATDTHDPEYGWILGDEYATRGKGPGDDVKVSMLIFEKGTRMARYPNSRVADGEEITAGKFEIVGIETFTNGPKAASQFDFEKQQRHYFPTTYYTLRQTHVFDRRTGTYVSVDAPQAPSAVVAACYSAACAPPSAGGTGGSLPRGSAAAVAAQAARAAAGAKAVKPAKPKGGSERTAGLGVPVHNETEFTRRIAAAIAAEPALQGMKSMQQRKDEVETEFQQAVAKHESEWRRKLREGTDPADIGLRVRTSVWVAGSQFPKSERDAVERSMHEAMVKILDDPSFVPQTEIEKAAFRIMKMRLEENGGRTPYVSTNFQYILSDGTKVDMDAAHFVDSYPVKKKPSLDDPAITPEFEAATRRIGGMVREEVVARTQRIVDATSQSDWDGIEAAKQRLLASGKEVFFTVTNGIVRVKQIGKSTSETEADPEIAAFKKMIEGSGITSDIRALHEAGARSKAEQQAMREVLAEVRPIGGRFDGTPNHRAPSRRDQRSSHEQVMLATRLIPSDWIDISNARGRINFKSTKGRAHYVDWSSEITLSGKTSVALHELMHRAEYTVPGLAQLERTFLDRRAAGETPTRLNQILPGSKYRDDEVATPDQLFDPYAGKVYKDGAREVMSMGMEYLLSQGIGRVGSGTAPDADYADFVLGALSVLGRNT